MPTRAPQLFCQFGRRRMRFTELLFETFTLRPVLFHVTLIAEVEGDRAINLLEAQSRIMRSDGFRGLAAPKLLHDKCQRYPTSAHVEASVSAFNEFLGHNAPALSLNHSCSINDDSDDMIPDGIELLEAQGMLLANFRLLMGSPAGELDEKIGGDLEK